MAKKGRGILFIIIGLIILALLAGGYFVYKNYKTKQAKQTKSYGKLVYGYDEWPGVIGMLCAYEKGYIKDAGIDLELKKQVGTQEMLENIINGSIDFSVDIPASDIYRKKSQGITLAILGVNDYSAGGDAIIAKNDIKTLKDLRGNKIAVQKGTFENYLLYTGLSQIGLTLNDVIEIDTTSEKAGTAFKEGKVDAAVTYGPYLLEAQEAGGHIIFSSANALGAITDAVTMRKDFVEQNPEKVQALLGALFKGIDFAENNPDEASAIGAKYLSLSAAEIKEAFQGVNLLNLRENETAFSNNYSYASLYGNGIFVKEYLKAAGEFREDYNLDEIINDNFIRNLSNESAK